MPKELVLIVGMFLFSALDPLVLLLTAAAGYLPIYRWRLRLVPVLACGALAVIGFRLVLAQLGPPPHFLPFVSVAGSMAGSGVLLWWMWSRANRKRQAAGGQQVTTGPHAGETTA